MLRIIARNAASNWLGYASQIVIVFFLTPFVLKSLGDERYGIWALVSSLTGYYGLIALGLRAGVTQLMTYSFTAKDYEKLNRVASTATALLAICGVIALFAAALLAYFSPSVFTVTDELVDAMRACIVVVGIDVAIQLPLSPFSAVFVATQKYGISNIIGISTRVLTAIATITCLKLGYGLVGVAVAGTACNILGYIIRWRVAYKLLPQLSLSLDLIGGRKGVLEIVSLSSWNALGALAELLITSSSRIIIGIFMPLAALAPFSLAASLMEYTVRLLAPILLVLFPAVTQLRAEGDVHRLHKLYLLGSRVMTLIAIGAATIGIVWADDFFRLWIGSELGAANSYPSPALLTRVLLIGFVLTAGPRVGSQILIGCKHVRLYVLLSMAEAVLSVVLSLTLIVSHGLLGVCIAIVAAGGIVKAIIQPIFTCRIAGVAIREYLSQIVFRPFVYFICLALALAGIRTTCPTATSWLELLFSGTIASLVAATLFIFVGLSAIERRVYVYALFSSIVSSIKSSFASNLPAEESKVP